MDFRSTDGAWNEWQGGRMRDARHDVGLTGGPWPAAVISELPVGLLEVDASGRVVRVNPALVRLLAAAGVPPPPSYPLSLFDGGLAADGTAAEEPAVEGRLVTAHWPWLAEATLAVLSGRAVDTLLQTPGGELRVCGVPRWFGTRPHGGLLVVSLTSSDRSAIVDLRGGGPVDPAQGGPAPSTAESPRRQPVGRTDEHAATHDVLTGLPNQVLLVQRLADALASCRPGHRIGVLATQMGGGPGAVEDGDLLRALAHRLPRGAGPGDFAARLDGARFAVVLPDVRAGVDVERFLSRMDRRLRGPGRGSTPDAAVRGHGNWAPDGPATQSQTDDRSAGGSMVDGLGMVLADPATGAAVDRDPGLVLALALEALERSRVSGRPVLGTELPTDAERARLAALKEYDLYDGELGEALQGITQVALATCDALTALVTFVDSDLQWVRAASGWQVATSRDVAAGRDVAAARDVAAGRQVAVGRDVPAGADVAAYVDGRAPRHLTLCDRTMQGRGVLVVPDIEADPVFPVSRHVIWQLGMRFYAGAPLITGEGRVVGTLCVFDHRPRGLSERQRRSLAALASETVALLDGHRGRRAP